MTVQSAPCLTHGQCQGDFVLLDRDSFHAMRGFNEVYRVARIGIDRNLLVKALSLGDRIEDIGGPCDT